jgi:hypothetical protein
MTDKDLIRLAVKAMVAQGFKTGLYRTVDEAAADICKSGTFNPLVNDADAFRLSVSLGMRVHQMPGFGCDSVICAADGGWAQEPYGTDRLAATRRAATRAAAEIARTLP